MSPDGAQIAAADADGHASIIDAATGAEVHSFRMAVGRRQEVAGLQSGRTTAGEHG